MRKLSSLSVWASGLFEPPEAFRSDWDSPCREINLNWEESFNYRIHLFHLTRYIRCVRGVVSPLMPPPTHPHPEEYSHYRTVYCMLKTKNPTYNIHYMFHVTFSITSATRGGVFREHPWSRTCPRMLLQRRAPTTDINNSDWVNHVERQALKSSVPECVFECIKPHPPTGSGHLQQGEQIFFFFSKDFESQMRKPRLVEAVWSVHQ